MRLLSLGKLTAGFISCILIGAEFIELALAKQANNDFVVEIDGCEVE